MAYEIGIRKMNTTSMSECSSLKTNAIHEQTNHDVDVNATGEQQQQQQQMENEY